MAPIGDWMQTFTGGMFWPMDPRVEDVRIEDIAHSLALQCRYAGHCLNFYSVAEHCCLLHDYAPEPLKKWALLHDASEAYLVDVPRPLKPFLTGYKAAEDRVMQVIQEKFNLGDMPDAIKEMDNGILADEQAWNMAPPPREWKTGKRLGVKLGFWSSHRAEHEFLKRAELYGC